MNPWTWLLLATGALGGRMTNLWGGFISCLAYVSVVGAVWRRFTCHGKWWCWRHPHFNLAGSPYMVCGKHHPDDQPTVEQVTDRIREARRGR